MEKPVVSPAAVGAAISALGTIITNVYVFHALAFADRAAALALVMKVARDAARVVPTKPGDESHIAERDKVVDFILTQCEENARRHYLEADRSKPTLN